MGDVAKSPFLQGARHWVYVDRQRTHEVHAEVEPRGLQADLVVTEFPFGGHRASEMSEQRFALEQPWEVRLELAALETRLALMGEYWKSEAGRASWTRVPARAPAAPVRLDAHHLPLPGADDARAVVGFHHFHDRKAHRDRMLVSLPRLDLDAVRFVLADLAFRFPDVDRGELRILHARLSQPMLQSALVREHLRLPADGYAKLVDALDYAAAFGPDWRARLRESFAALTRRILDARTGPGPAEEAPPPTPEVDLARLRDALRDPSLAQIRARYLGADLEGALLAQGELAVRRWVAQRRRSVAHGEQHLLSALESYLLTRYGWSAGRAGLRDGEGAKLLRHLATLR